jgi:hypothetical protein
MGSVVGAVAWLVSVSLVVEVGLFRLGFGVVAVGWPLGGALIRVAVRRCRMCCIMLVAGGGFILAFCCGAVGWRLVGFLMGWLLGVMGEKYIWMVVWDLGRRDLEGRVG